MGAEWQWDPTLFRGAAKYYERGRLPYARAFAPRLAQILDLDGRGRLLDVGCGPGIVALELAPYFEAVVGIDPDAEMLAAAEQRATRLGISNGSWVRARAEDLPAGLGKFRVAAFGQSFHWTDREQVATTVREMLEAGGAFVHVADIKNPAPAQSTLPHPPPPYDDIKQIARKYLGAVRRAGQTSLPKGTPTNEEDVLAAAGFSNMHRYELLSEDVVERSVDDLLAWAFSRSDCAPHLFGDDVARFEGDVREMLLERSPAGLFSQSHPGTDVIVWSRD